MGDGLRGGGSWGDRSCRALWQFSMLVELYFIVCVLFGAGGAVLGLPGSLWEMDTYLNVGLLVLFVWFFWETFRGRRVRRLWIYFGGAVVAVGIAFVALAMFATVATEAWYLLQGVALLMVSVPFAVGFGMRIRMLRREAVRGFEVVGVVGRDVGV